ncbi:MAG: signal peptidase I [Lachnospiraceae bacterium]|nr:signal peptidase I [Lachnospiraceae bacterium]
MRKRRGGLNFNRKRRTINADVLREIISWTLHIVIAVFAAGWLVYFVGMRTSVIGVSMEGSLYNGQQILVNRLSYLVFSPKPGDVIVFQPNGNRNSHYYVKRVVAGPGDRVQIKDGKLYVNDTITDYGYDKIMDPGIAENEILLETDEFFVMGDNCNNSEDSRSGNIGPVSRQAIEGKAWFKFNSAESYMGLIE